MAHPFAASSTPFGDPVTRAFALFPGAEALGEASPLSQPIYGVRGWKGIDITREKAFQWVTAEAGLLASA